MIRRTKKSKHNGTYYAFHGPLSQEWIDGRFWSVAVIFYANQSNDYYTTLMESFIEIMSQYQVVCIAKIRSITGLKQRKIH